MLNRLKGHVSFANVVALIALFVSLGGASYAAIKLPARSVGTKQLKNGAVTKKKVAKSLRKSLRGPAGRDGAPGPKGPRGDRGAACPASVPACRGPAGTPGPAAVSKSLTSMAPGDTQAVSVGAFPLGAECASGGFAQPRGSISLFAEASYTAQVNEVIAQDDANPVPHLFGHGGGDYLTVTDPAPAGHYIRKAGTALVTFEGRVYTLHYSLISDNRGAQPACQVHASGYEGALSANTPY